VLKIPKYLNTSRHGPKKTQDTFANDIQCLFDVTLKVALPQISDLSSSKRSLLDILALPQCLFSYSLLNFIEVMLAFFRSSLGFLKDINWGNFLYELSICYLRLFISVFLICWFTNKHQMWYAISPCQISIFTRG